MIREHTKENIKEAASKPNRAEILDGYVMDALQRADWELFEYLTVNYFLYLSDKAQNWLFLATKMAQLCIRKVQAKR